MRPEGGNIYNSFFFRRTVAGTPKRGQKVETFIIVFFFVGLLLEHRNEARRWKHL